MAAETAVDCLLENLMRLINSDNELILKAFEKILVLIDKGDIKWVYKEMLFLRKFLKDSEKERDEHEELKSIAAKIRDVSYKTDDIIDWSVLKAFLQLTDGSTTTYGFDLEISSVWRICESFEDLIKEVCSVKKCKRDVMETLSWLQSHHDVIIEEEMKPIIEEARYILDKGSSLRLLETNLFYYKDIDQLVVYLHRLSREKIRQVDHLLLNTSSEEIPDGFGSILEEMKLFTEEVMKIYETTETTVLESSLCDELASLCALSIEKIGEIDVLLNSSSSEEIQNGFGGKIEEIKSIIEEVMEIRKTDQIHDGYADLVYHSFYYKKIRQLATIGLSGANICEVKVDLLYHSSTEERPSEIDRLYRLSRVFSYLAAKFYHLSRISYEDCCHLLRTYEEMVDLAEKIRHSIGRMAEEIKPIKRVVMQIYKKGLSVPRINSLMPPHFHLLPTFSQELVDLANKIPRSFDLVIEETNSVETEVMWIYHKCLESVTGDEIHKWFGIVTEEIKSIKREVMKIYNNKRYGIGWLRVGESSRGASSIPTTFIFKEELVVGLDDETTAIMELLANEHQKQLKVIPIIGMAGLGKTTLAMKVYSDPLTEYMFHFRAWTHVSHVCSGRDLLLSILSGGNIQLKGKLEKIRDEELGERLYRALKCKRYLIVMDDIWEFRVWDDMKKYLPNDDNGSRIIITSRLPDVASAIHAIPHYLRFLHSDESWDLLQQKVFQGGSCPQELIEIGKQISRKCRGLPLAIVVIAGLLARKDKTQDSWRHVAESVSSYVTEQEQFMDALTLSYNHLPYHLKPCFLYFGAFPEDYEIPIWKLIWLWIAEGFIVQNQQKSLEEVGEDYVVDLIDRSLVVVSNRRSNGAIKACHVNDLWRHLCLRKAQEENFMYVSRYEPTSSSFSSPMAKKQRRICIDTHFELSTIHTLLNGCGYSKYGDPEVRSFSSTAELPLFSLLTLCSAFKLLRVLNISSAKISSFPEELQLLVHLRYLSFHVANEYFRPSISNLWKLETFLIEGGRTGRVSFSHDIWKMVKLRHLYSKRFIEIPRAPNDDYPFVLDDLQTMGKLDLHDVDEEVLRWIPNLRKLTCSFRESLGRDDIFPKLDFLNYLETLNITYGGFRKHLGRFPHLYKFPRNLKCLTLSNFCLTWEEMSVLGKLPNLEVLKLSYKAFEGPRWDTSDGLFHKLKFLKFQRLDIKQWTASSDPFPNLQTLVLDGCKQLEEIPFGLGDISTLERIQLWYCSISAANSAWKIQDCQQSLGNDVLKIHIYHCNNEDYNEDTDADTH